MATLQIPGGEASRGRCADGDARHGMIEDGRQSASWVAWWHDVAAPPVPPDDSPLDVRERVRRAYHASTLLGVVALVWLALLSIAVGVGLERSLVTFVLSGATIGAGVWLNRRGMTYGAGLLLIGLLHAAYWALVLGRGELAMSPAATGLLLCGILVACATLAPAAILGVAAWNVATIAIAVVYAMPTTPAFGTLHGPELISLAAQPIALQMLVALFACPLAGSAQQALARAEAARLRAQEGRRRAERRAAALAAGAEELLTVHVQVANGNLHVRARQVGDPMLWKVGQSLNMLISRLSRVAAADFQLQRAQEEAGRLAETIQAMREGRRPVWPAPTGTALDVVIMALVGIEADRTPALDQARIITDHSPAVTPTPARLAPPDAPGRPAAGPVAGPVAGESQAALPDWLLDCLRRPSAPARDDALPVAARDGQ